MLVPRLTLVAACVLVALPAMGGMVVLKEGTALNLSGGLDPALADLRAKDIVHVAADDTAFHSNLAANTGYGSLDVFQSYMPDMLFKFDLAALPGFTGGTVRAAQLRIRQLTGSGAAPSCGRVLYHDWTESKATRFDPLGTSSLRWGAGSNSKFSGAGDAGPLTAMTLVDDPSGFEDWYVVDVTADAQAMANGTVPNYGWYIYGGGNRSYFASESARDGDRPALFLSYIPAGATNTPPVVQAGPDQTITLPVAADLCGSAVDDGLPYPSAGLTYSWTQDSGPGVVTFGNPTARRTSASFGTSGTYVLRLTVSDGALSGSGTVTITVSPAVNNAAPVVYAGADQAISWPATVALSGSATDDGLPSGPDVSTYAWTKVSGPGTVIFSDITAAATTATFSVPGTYVLRLAASDGDLSGSDTLTVAVASGTPGIRIVRTGAAYGSIQAAHDAAIAGDTIEIASGTYAGDAVRTEISKPNLTIRGVGPTRPVLDSYYEVKNSKGLFVTTSGGSNLTIENLELCNAYSIWASNAACIRMQSAGMTVRNCYFHDGGNGILSQGFAGSNVLLEYCEFANLGTGAGQEHNLYIGFEDSFTMRYCYSHNCNAGHLVKTRARKNYILYNRIGNFGGQESYEINIPSAGESYVIGNLIYQSATSQNTTIIDYLSEYPTVSYPLLPEPNPDWHLYVINNTIVNDLPGAIFVRNGVGSLDNNDSDTNPNYFPVALVQNNIFAGPGTAISTAAAGTTTQLNNWSTTVASACLAWPFMFDYQLTAGSTGAINLGSDPGTSHTGYSLAPTQQYVHPLNHQDRPSNGTIDIGAYEYLTPPANQAPFVDAGPDQVTTPPRYTINLAGTASDDGLPSAMTCTWSQVSGPGTITFGSAGAPNTTATFSDAGTYVLQLQASDGVLSSSDTVAVTLKPDPQLGGPIIFQNGALPDVTYTGCQTTHLNQNNPTYNYGGQTGSIGAYAGTNRALIRFAVGIVPANASIRSAMLRLRICGTGTGAAGAVVRAYRALQPWARSGASWNNFVPGLAWNSPGCGSAGVDRASAFSGSAWVPAMLVIPFWVELPLDPSLVQGWVSGTIENNGVVLKLVDEAGGTLHYIGENNAILENRPQLVVDYSPQKIGDIDGDGQVNLADLKLLIAAWNSMLQPPSANWNPDADLDGDNYVNLSDLKILVAHWNQ